MQRCLPNAPEHTLEEFFKIAKGILKRGHAVMGIGPRGIGKTERTAKLAEEMGLVYVPFILGHKEKSDLLIPRFDPITGSIVEYPLGSLKLGVTTPALVHIDEFNRTEDSLQSALLTIVNERRIGDFVFAPGTCFVMTGNPPDHAGANQPLDTLIGRAWCAHIKADLGEVRAYLTRLGVEGSTERMLGVDIAATAASRPDLIAIEPPDGAENGALYPQPRQVVYAIQDAAAYGDGGGQISDPAVMSILSGRMGRETAAALTTLWRMRDKLPTVEEIVKSPDTAKLPSDMESGVAALGLVAMAHKAGKQGVNSAWIYTGRLPQRDIQNALGRALLGQIPTDAGALKVHHKLIGQAGAMLSGNF